MRCPKCGFSSPEGKTTCTLCGASLEEVIRKEEERKKKEENIIYEFKPKNTWTKCIVTALTAAIILAIVFFRFYSAGFGYKNIEMVKKGMFDQYPSMTIGACFDKAFSNTKWEQFKGTDGNQYVNFTGYAQGNNAKYKIQFSLNGSQFNINALEINDEPQNRLIINVLLEGLFGQLTVN